MGIRITQQQSISQSVRQAQLRQQQMANLQRQLATGLRVGKPTDDPGAWGVISANKVSVRRANTDLENISTVRQRLNQSTASLTEAGNLLVRARELALSGEQSQERETLALEVDGLIDGLLSIANSADAGIHLFSGTASDKVPFAVTDVDHHGRPIRIQYLGSEDESHVLVGPNSAVRMLASGSKIFQQSDRQDTTYLGSTGASAGAGTDNATRVGEVRVRHTGTSYGAGNVAPGASSIGGDTIIGPPGEHHLTIQDDPIKGRVVRLNDGAAVPFDGSSSDLQVRGAGGDVLWVDMTAVPSSFTGIVEITASGTLSVDGGASEVPIDFSNSQLVTHQTSGAVTVVDSSGIRRTGTDRVEYAGTAGAFESLMLLRDDLRRADEWSTPEFSSIMAARISDITRAHSQILDFVGEQSVELANVERLETRTRELQLVTEQATIELESADMADVITRLQNEQNHLQYIYAATANLFQTNILDFL
jgi:flagellin-like hook-associated protein FlgL